MQIIQISDINVEIFKKDIKNIHLWVYPPFWRVRVASPLDTDDEVIRLLIVSKLTWIKKQIKKFISQERETKREYVNWESHFYLWKRYLLRVKKWNKWKVEIKNKKYIDLYVKDINSFKQKENTMKKWYRKELKYICEDLTQKWVKTTGADLSEMKIRVMKTKWGSCNIEEKRIWLNLELIKKDKKHIEYVILHELVHLFERKHNDNFKEYMNRFMPNWREIKEDMNAGVLRYS